MLFICLPLVTCYLLCPFSACRHHTLPTNLTAPRFTEFASEEDAASDVTSESAVSGTQSSPHATLQMSGNTAQLEALRIAQYAEHLSKELEEQKEITVNLQTAIHDLKVCPVINMMTLIVCCFVKCLRVIFLTLFGVLSKFCLLLLLLLLLMSCQKFGTV